MKVEGKLVVGVVLLLGLGGGIYMSQQEQKKEAEQHTAVAAEDMPVVKLDKAGAEGLTKFVIKNKNKGEVTLEKKGDKWELTAPLNAPANQANVKNLIENIQKIELKAQIANTAEPYKKYELDDEMGVHVQAFAGADKKLDMYFGKSGSRGQMARIAGTDGVFTAKGYSSYLWSRETKNWRENEILKFEDANAVAIEVENPNGKFSFTKAEDKWSAAFYKRDEEGELGEKPEEWEGFDEAKVKDLLRAYKNLKATNFAEKGAATGTDAPLKEGGVVRIKMKDDSATHELHIGSLQEGSNRYLLKKGGDGTVYVVSSWAADWATAEPKKFEKSEEKPAGEGPPPGMPGMPMKMPGM